MGRDEMNARERELRLLAMQIVVQLPESNEEAAHVLVLARELKLGWVSAAATPVLVVV